MDTGHQRDEPHHRCRHVGAGFREDSGPSSHEQLLLLPDRQTVAGGEGAHWMEPPVAQDIEPERAG